MDKSGYKVSRKIDAVIERFEDDCEGAHIDDVMINCAKDAIIKAYDLGLNISIDLIRTQKYNWE